MNTTTTRVARYVGAGFAGIAISCTLATPALAMRPDPIPGSGEQYSPQTTTGSSSATAPAATTDEGYDWSTLATGLGSGALLGGIVVLGANQARRRQVRPA